MKVKSIYILMTPNCNLRCKYYFQDGGYHDQPRAVASREVIDRFVEFCVNSEAQHVDIFGGEPLLYKDAFCHTAESLRKRIPDTSVGVVTNGTLIDEELMKLFERELISMLLSMDGPKERHDRFRGGFDRISKWLKRLAALDRVTIAMQGGMISGLYDSIRYFWDLGFKKGVYINLIQNQGWYSPGDVSLFEREYDRALQGMLKGEGRLQCAIQMYHLLKEPKTHQGCGITSQGLACDWQGKLYPCHRAMELGARFAVGDVQNGVDKAVNQDLRRTIHAAAFGSESSRRFPLVSFCPVNVHLAHQRFDGEWPVEFCEMIEIKAKLVSKYYHEIEAQENKKEEAKAGQAEDVADRC